MTTHTTPRTDTVQTGSRSSRPRARLLARTAVALAALGALGGAAAGGALGALQASTDRLVFADPQGGAASPAKTVTVSNPSGSAFQLTGFTIGGTNGNQFALSGAPGTPATVPAGGSVQVPVVFAPGTTGVKAGQLTIATNDPAAPSIAVTLRGLGTTSATGEPSLQYVFDTWQIPVATGDPTPANAPLGSGGPMGDEVDIERFQPAGAGPVTVTPIASYTLPGPGSATSAFGYYTGSGGSGTQQLFTIDNASARALEPGISGTTSFNPGGPFSLYATYYGFGGRTTYGQDALNTWDDTVANRHKMRVYPMRNPNGSAVPNSFVVAFEDSDADPADNQDTVVILSNVTAVGAVGGANIGIQNLDGVPFADRLVMNRIQGGATGIVTKETATLRISNSGSQPLTITGLGISGPFTLNTAISLPRQVPAFGTLDVPVRFTGQGNQQTDPPRVDNGTLTITSNDADEPTISVQLAGLWQGKPEGSNEGTLAEIFSVFGYATRIVNANSPGNDISKQGRVEPVGEEVLSPYWRRLDTSRPVQVRQLAAFHGSGTGTVYWFPQGDPGGVKSIFTHDDLEYQTVLPRHTNLQGPAQGTFTPTNPVFGFRLASAWSDDSMNEFTQSCLNDPAAPKCGHVVRFWPIKDRSGIVQPGQYLAAMDFANANTGNYDYQDNIYLVSNVVPEAGVPVDTTKPTVQTGTRTPGANATGVAVGTNVSLTFSEAMDPSSVNTGSFTLAPAAGGAPVAATISVSGSNGTFTLDPTAALAPSTQYRVTITTAVRDVAGNTMNANHTWTFTTGAATGDIVAPSVTATTPAPGATGVAVGSNVTATFSEAVAAATVGTASVTLVPEGGDSEPVAGTVTLGSGNTVVTFNPATDLSTGTRYTATITTAVTDPAGNHLSAPAAWSFVTAGEGPATGGGGGGQQPVVPVAPPVVPAGPAAPVTPPVVTAKPKYTATGLKAVWNRKKGVLTITVKGRDKRSTVKVGARYLTPNKKGVIVVPRTKKGTILVRIQPTPLSRGILTPRTWKVTLPAKGAVKVKGL